MSYTTPNRYFWGGHPPHGQIPSRLPRRDIRVVALLLLAGQLLTGITRATEAVPLSLSETVRPADAIVAGTVIGQQSRWGNAAHT